MTLTLLFFASYTDIAGASELTADLADGSTVGDVAVWLVERYPRFAEILPKGRIAVNQEFAPSTLALADGDEVAFMPPMSGG